MSARHTARLLLATVLCGCGVGSVNPVVPDADAISDNRIIGTWQDERRKETATISVQADKKYRVVYTDEDGKVGRFIGMLGNVGAFQVLDLQPEEPVPAASDAQRSLLLRAHGVVVIASTGNVLKSRLLLKDSLVAHLNRPPTHTAHLTIANSVLLTASSTEVRRWLADILSRPGVLDEAGVWRRVSP
jgi:hypothetical protein